MVSVSRHHRRETVCVVAAEEKAHMISRSILFGLVFSRRRSMRSPMGLSGGLMGLLVGLFVVGPVRAGEGPINLLRLSSARVERTSPATVKPTDLQAWTDGKPMTSAAVEVIKSSPVEVVFGFGGVVSVERVVVRLAAGSPELRLEVLVSTVSPQAGFQHLRADLLRATTQPQAFRVPQAATRWILFRLTPTKDARKIDLAELECLGREGPPAVALRLQGCADRCVSRPGQAEGAQRAGAANHRRRDGPVCRRPRRPVPHLVDARGGPGGVGVTGAARRKAYLARFDKLVGAARAATAKGKTAAQKGQMPLAYLHAGPMAKEYVAGQTTLSGVLDTGTFNCVSSAVLYNALALRLGLDARAVEVPDHAFSVVYDRNRSLDVETTTKAGFNPARDPQAKRQLERLTGFQYIPDGNRDKRCEVREAGLVAIIYYNRGVRALEEKRYHEALLHFFRAMSVDREFASAVKNALAALGNCSVELAGAGKFKDGLAVLSVGLELAPRDATLLHNRKAFWGRWAERLGAAGETDEALDVLTRAAREVAGEAAYFQSQRSWIFLRRGEALVKLGKWAEARDAVALGLKKLEGAPREEVVKWQRELALRHGSALLDKADHAGAVRILAEAMKSDPGYDRLGAHLCFTVRKWAWRVYQREGEAKARALLQAQLASHGKAPGMADVIYAHTHSIVKEHRSAGKAADALAAIDRHAPLFTKNEDLRDLIRTVADRRSGELASRGNHLEALGVYDSVLKRLPGDGHLLSNRRARMTQYVLAMHARGEAEAISVLAQLRKRYPGEKRLDDMARSQAHRVARALTGKGKFEEALKAVERHRSVLAPAAAAQEKAVRSLSCMVYDDWAAPWKKKGEWQKALDVYARGLKQFPNEYHLETDAINVWDRWARTYFRKDWDEAIRVYEKALKQFPKSFQLKNNRDYWKQEKRKKGKDSG
jgi:tetratricopeptide (TPR) repeat protein